MDYRIIYSVRKTVSIIVERDRSIVVRAPIGTSEERIHELVEAKKLWLYEKTHSEQKYPEKPARKEFVTGETLMYLGRNYRLEITDDDAPGVRFVGRFLISRQHQRDASRLLREWYVERAHEKLLPRVDRFAQALGVSYNRVLVSDMMYRWASCTPRGNLNFSWRVIKAPTYVGDYVIVHELAHLREANHTDEFWNIVAVQAPRYAEAQSWLRDNGNLLEEDL